MTEQDCPQCGEPTLQFYEGYCEQCCLENQAALDKHNADYDYWTRLDNERREELIRQSYD